jgi:hypothetical protein
MGADACDDPKTHRQKAIYTLHRQPTRATQPTEQDVRIPDGISSSTAAATRSATAAPNGFDVMLGDDESAATRFAGRPWRRRRDFRKLAALIEGGVRCSAFCALSLP